MNWDDVGYLVSKNRYNENSIIAEIYTRNHGKYSGIIFGATSKKIKNYLQIGNELYVNYNYKSENKLGYFKIEIAKAYAPYYFENKKKLFCISSAMNLIKLLTAESQSNDKIYESICDFYILLQYSNWVKEYIFWELKLLGYLGYHLDLEKITESEVINNEKKYFVRSSTEKKYIPNYFIETKENNFDKTNLLNGLKLVGDFLDKNVLKPNNINYPISRLHFLDLFR
jgi:DNA repair protein RecO (recombination protein O)